MKLIASTVAVAVLLAALGGCAAAPQPALAAAGEPEQTRSFAINDGLHRLAASLHHAQDQDEDAMLLLATGGLPLVADGYVHSLYFEPATGRYWIKGVGGITGLQTYWRGPAEADHPSVREALEAVFAARLEPLVTNQQIAMTIAAARPGARYHEGLDAWTIKITFALLGPADITAHEALRLQAEIAADPAEWLQIIDDRGEVVALRQPQTPGASITWARDVAKQIDLGDGRVLVLHHATVPLAAKPAMGRYGVRFLPGTIAGGGTELVMAGDARLWTVDRLR